MNASTVTRAVCVHYDNVTLENGMAEIQLINDI